MKRPSLNNISEIRSDNNQKKTGDHTPSFNTMIVGVWPAKAMACAVEDYLKGYFKKSNEF